MLAASCGLATERPAGVLSPLRHVDGIGDGVPSGGGMLDAWNMPVGIGGGIMGIGGGMPCATGWSVPIPCGICATYGVAGVEGAGVEGIHTEKCTGGTIGGG